MSWILAAVVVALAGLVVLAVLSLRVLVAARTLARALDVTRARLTPIGEESGQKIQLAKGAEG